MSRFGESWNSGELVLTWGSSLHGATHPAEFFAVATKAYFEKPRQLNKKHPELYQELKNYYKVDPLVKTEDKTEAVYDFMTLFIYLFLDAV